MLLVAAMIGAPAASADTICKFDDLLATVPGSSGTGRATLDTASWQLHAEITYSRLSDTPSKAEFFCCAPSGGQPQPAVHLDYSFVAGSTGLLDKSYDLSLATYWYSGFLSQYASPAAAAAAFGSSLQGGGVYANVSTPNLPFGELRGFMKSRCDLLRR